MGVVCQPEFLVLISITLLGFFGGAGGFVKSIIVLEHYSPRGCQILAEAQETRSMNFDPST